MDCSSRRVAFFGFIYSLIGALSLAASYANAQGVAGEFEEGRRYANNGDFASARAIWERLALSGDARSQLNLGRLYANGDGVPVDYGKAKEWFAKAAALNLPEAQYALAKLYLYGDGVAPSREEAIRLLRLAASRGDEDAAHALQDLGDSRSDSSSGSTSSARLGSPRGADSQIPSRSPSAVDLPQTSENYRTIGNDRSPSLYRDAPVATFGHWTECKPLTTPILPISTETDESLRQRLAQVEEALGDLMQKVDKRVHEIVRDDIARQLWSCGVRSGYVAKALRAATERHRPEEICSELRQMNMEQNLYNKIHHALRTAGLSRSPMRYGFCIAHTEPNPTCLPVDNSDRAEAIELIKDVSIKADDDLQKAIQETRARLKAFVKTETLSDANRAAKSSESANTEGEQTIDSFRTFGPFRIGTPVAEYRDLGIGEGAKSYPNYPCDTYWLACHSGMTVETYSFVPRVNPLSFGGVPVNEVMLETIADQLVAITLRLSPNDPEAFAVLVGALSRNFGDPEITGSAVETMIWRGKDIFLRRRDFGIEFSIASKAAIDEARERLNASEEAKRQERERKIRELKF